MESGSTVLLKGIVNTGLASIVAYVIFKLAYPSGRADSATSLGRKFLVWELVLSTVTMLPKYFHHTNQENLIQWLVVSISGGCLAFIVGYIVFYLRNSGSVLKVAIDQGAKAASSVYDGMKDQVELGGTDDKFYEIALREIESNSLHKVTWSKALEKSGGNLDKCKAIYINSRVAYFKTLNRQKTAENNDRRQSVTTSNALTSIHPIYNDSNALWRAWKTWILVAIILFLIFVVNVKVQREKELEEQVSTLDNSMRVIYLESRKLEINLDNLKDKLQIIKNEVELLELNARAQAMAINGFKILDWKDVMPEVIDSTTELNRSVQDVSDAVKVAIRDADS